MYERVDGFKRFFWWVDYLVEILMGWDYSVYVLRMWVRVEGLLKVVELIYRYILYVLGRFLG